MGLGLCLYYRWRTRGISASPDLALIHFDSHPLGEENLSAFTGSYSSGIDGGRLGGWWWGGRGPAEGG